MWSESWTATSRHQHPLKTPHPCRQTCAQNPKPCTAGYQCFNCACRCKVGNCIGDSTAIMLRLYQRTHTSLRQFLTGSTAVREYAAVAWPTDVSVPDGMTPFDPKGSLGQVDKYTQGLPEDDALVHYVRKMRDLRLAVDKLETEKKAVRSHPSGASNRGKGNSFASIDLSVNSACEPCRQVQACLVA